MALPEVKTIQDAVDLIYDKLKKDFDTDVTTNKMEVTKLELGRIENFKTNNGSGAIILFYDGSKLGSTVNKNVVHCDRIFRIVCFLQIPVTKGQAYRNEKIDAVIDSAAGLKFSTYSKADRVKPASDEYLSPAEDADKQFYEQPIVFEVPAQYTQQDNLT